MIELATIEDLPTDLHGGALSIGNFDGVHRGHVEIVRRVKQLAQRLGGPAIIFTFDPHPVRLLRPEMAPPPLTWTRRKALLLADLGIDALIAYPTDEALLALSPHEFFQRIVVEQLAAKGMVEGANFFFGKDRRGDIGLLQHLCENRGIALDVVQPLAHEGHIVSSSRIRETLATGDVELAGKLLGRPYRVRGMVTHGAQRGGSIGFPTANLEAIDTIVPGFGVYAGRAVLGDQSFVAAINVGTNPTFGDDARKVEVHLLDFAQSIYAEPLEVDFLARLRDIQQFADADELKSQLALDVQRARTVAAQRPL